jgi:predicted RNA binding protein YcfA (HicA-like mRNA interferase family)
MIFNENSSSITAKLRLTVRDGFGAELISSAFDMTVTDPKVDEEQDCLNEFVTKEDQISHDLKLAFTQNVADGMDEYAQIEIGSPLNTKWNDASLDCMLQYKLQAWQKEESKYIDWDDFVDLIKSEVDNKVLYSDIHFDSHSGYFNAWFSKKDITALTTRLTEAGAVEFKFRIVARVVGSQVAGAAITDYSSLVTAEFKVVYVPETQVEECADNTLISTGLTAAGERSSDFEYTIQGKDQTPDVLTIPAIKVDSKGCSTTTVLEYLHPTEGWQEAREKDGHVAFTYDADGHMTVTFQTKQDWFISDLVPTFGQEYADGTLPNDVQIEMQFRTTDDVSGDTFIDPWVLTVQKEPLETESDFCDFSGLSLANAMTGARDYQIPETGTAIEPKEIWISTQLAGLDSLTSLCAPLVHLTVDIQLPGGRWMTIADESQGAVVNATHGEEHMDEAVYFKRTDEGDLYMVAQFGQEDFEKHTQTMYETLD